MSHEIATNGTPVFLGETFAGSAAAEAVRGATNTREPANLRMPMFIPKDELFFWTGAWQEGEEESAAEREAGNLRTFDDPRDFFRWLLSDED
jgi:hypothetical protein